MKLYLHYLSIHLRSQMQYKTSFFLTVLGQFVGSFTFLLSILFLMDRFGTVKGFTAAQVLLCFAVVLMAFSLAECFFRGFDTFASTISQGQFDRILVRPRSEVLLTLCSKAELSRIGRFLQSALVFAYAIPNSGVHWTWDKILTLCFMILSGVALFSGLFVIYAAICFFTTEGLEFMNIFTDGGREFGSYPIAVYGEKVLKFFTFIVPLALVQYYPFLYLVDRAEHRWYAVTPIAAWLFLIPCAILWKVGLRHYKSTGS
ncbi:MAG: ABC-2 family transporter protein [Clostridia bacterium]|nr:ABC-2 family transporter protein [Clostridia bacterium]